MDNLEHWMDNLEHWMDNLEHWMDNLEHWMDNLEHWMHNLEYCYIPRAIRRYSYFSRNICNRYADCLKQIFRTWSQACFAIVTTFLDEDPAWISCRLYIFCHLDISVESIAGRFICRQDQSNEEPLFIRPQFGSQFGVFHLLCFIKPMQHFNLNVFLYTPYSLQNALPALNNKRASFR